MTEINAKKNINRLACVAVATRPKPFRKLAAEKTPAAEAFG